MRKKKRRIFEEEEEFLDYLYRKSHDEEARKEENLIKKFGEENYKNIYSLIGGRKTGALPKKEGDKRTNILYINDEGLRFLEERKKEKNQRIIAILTLFSGIILVLVTAFYTYQTYRLNSITYDSFETSNRPNFVIKPISPEGMEMNESGLKLIITIINAGDTIGRLLAIQVNQELEKQDWVTLGAGKERNITMGKRSIQDYYNFTINIIYTGIGKLSNKNYSYARNVYIEKNKGGDFGVNSEEGEIT